MAARIRKTHQEEVRLKIQASQLINRLTDHALGNLDLSSSQIKAIEILLKKTLPDLTQVQGTGEDGEHLHRDVTRIELTTLK